MSARIAIIPARGGSKRIPLKNIRPFLGKPIISYSISAALESGLFTEVMVSTDDEQIAQVAVDYGAAVPFMRSAANASDVAGTAEVLCEVLDVYRVKSGRTFSEGCCIYPTAPFVTSDLLQKSYETFSKACADTLFPIMRYSYPIQRSVRKMPDGTVRMFWPENYQKRSQDLEPAYQDAGQFYWFKVPYMLENCKLFSDNSFGYEISDLDGQDIDNTTDWELAELKYKLKRTHQ
jgi:pseudaminic acid cytidylyltransferase